MSTSSAQRITGKHELDMVRSFSHASNATRRDTPMPHRFNNDGARVVMNIITQTAGSRGFAVPDDIRLRESFAPFEREMISGSRMQAGGAHA